jgi:hypothetical protein
MRRVVESGQVESGLCRRAKERPAQRGSDRCRRYTGDPWSRRPWIDIRCVGSGGNSCLGILMPRSKMRPLHGLVKLRRLPNGRGAHTAGEQS